MIRLLQFFLIVIFISSGREGHCQGNEIVYLLRPVSAGGYSIKVEMPEKVVSIADQGRRAFLFSRAQKSCNLDLDKLKNVFATLATREGQIFSQLDRLIEHSYEKIYDLDLTILIDDMGPGRQDFNSLYLPKAKGFPGPVIVLDCAETSQLFWTSSLTHELTHVLLNKYKVDSWFDEGIAQLNEMHLGGLQPLYRIKEFSKAQTIPTFLETRRPLPSGESYAVSYLLINYLYERFGGWRTLRAMAGITNIDNHCETEKEFLKRSLCRARSQKEMMAMDNTSDKLTPNGILRFFSIALVMSNFEFPLYSLPNWSGFVDLRETNEIEPYSLALSRKPHYRPINTEIESYLLYGDKIDFKIKPLLGGHLEPSPSSEGGTVININLSAKKVRF